MSIAEKVDNGNATDIEKADLALLNDACKKLESSVGVEMLTTFKTDLCQQLSLTGAFLTSSENNGVVNETIYESNTQADHMLAFRAMNKSSDYIHSADTDFVAFVGPKCVLMKNVNFTRNSKSKQYKSTYTLIGGGEEQFSLVSMFYFTHYDTQSLAFLAWGCVS